MRSMRCESCGTKALMAASKCPKCGHGFEVRDGFGDMLPLSHCPTCDAYYPTKLGSCKWCGTQPERAPVGPYVWKGVGVAAFLAMAWGAWLVHDDPPAEVSAKRMQAMLKPDSSLLADTALARMTIESAGIIDSVPTSTDVVVPDSSGGVALPVVAQVDTVSVSATGVVAVSEPIVEIDSAPAREPDPPPAPEPVRTATRAVAPPSREAAPAPAPRPDRTRTRVATGSSSRTSASVTKAPRAKAPAKTPPRSVASAKTPPKSVAKAPVKRSTKSVAAAPKARSSTRWVNSIARSWVIVRASASPQSRIIASIGPNTRVQLGESRGGWRRIKAKGLAGWVEHRSFFAGTSGSRGTSRLAAR